MRTTLASLAGLAALVVPATLSGQDTEWNRYTLAELAGVYVHAVANPTCETGGVQPAGIQSAAEARLTEAGVAVLDEATMLETPGLPELRISLVCAPGQGGAADGTVGFAVSIRLQQAAQMIRDPQITLSEAVTWFADTVGVATSGGLPAAVEGAVGGTLDAFAAAYAAANPVEAENGDQGPPDSRP